MGAITEIERRLIELRSEDDAVVPVMRTSVMTHLAWVPPEWADKARQVLEGLGERHPSRTILIEPQTGEADGIEHSVSLQIFPLPNGGPQICSEVIELRLSGQPAKAPASVVQPLLVFDLPVFLRWRGLPPFGAPEFEQLVDLADRVIVDSSEWDDPAAGYRELVRYFERAAFSDIAWSRTLPTRRALAAQWPELGAVEGPPAETHLLAGWLRSRAGQELEIHEAPDLAEEDERTPSDLLSDELDNFSRDPVYEAAVRGV